jgi:hypothetical protein
MNSIKIITTILITFLLSHSVVAQVYYDKDTIFLTLDQVEDIPQGLKPILYNNTQSDIMYKWRRTKIKGPVDLNIVSEDQLFQTYDSSSCSIPLINLTLSGESYNQIGIDALLKSSPIPDSLPWIILFEVLRAPSCDSIYASVVYVVGDLSSTLDNNSNNQFSFFPNPCDDFLTVQPNIDNSYNVRVYDQMSRCVYLKNNLYGTSRIELNDLPKGIYILKTEGKAIKGNYKMFVKG